MADEVLYTEPTSKVDLARRLDANHQDPQTEARDFAVEGNDVSGFMGVSPEYATYANDGEKPLAAEEGPEKEVEDRLAATLDSGGIGIAEEDPSGDDSDEPTEAPKNAPEPKSDLDKAPVSNTPAPPPAL